MKIREAEIHNFKGIDEWSILFQPGFNLIKGINGKGKTSVLEALAVGLGGFLEGVDGVKPRNFSKEETRKEYFRVGEGAYVVQYQLPTQISLKVEIEDAGEYSWTRSKNSLKPGKGTTQPRNIVRLAEDISNSVGTILPIVSYQGAGRVWAQKKEATENVFRDKYLRTVGYVEALEESSSIKMLLNWCVKMEQVSWQKNQKIAEYEAVKRAVAHFMGLMDHGSRYEVFYDKQTEELMYSEGGMVLSVTDLSSGYQSLIWMVFDIAFRMALLNPFLLEKITETPGIVLIDELDMHLHPKWQWKVIRALRETFPNVQFIAATHAPILFASAEDVWVIDIEGEKPGYSKSHYGIDVNTAVKQFQGRYDLPEEVAELSNAFYEAMDKEDYSNAKKMLDQLSAKTAPEFPLIVDMRMMYEIETNWPEE